MFGELIASIAARGEEQRKNGTYTAEDGLLRCAECHSPLQAVVEEMKPFLQDGICPIPCLCMEEKDIEQRLESRSIQEQLRRSSDRKRSLDGGRFVGFTFGADNGSHPDVTERCLRYADNFAEISAQGMGMLITGGIGSGKTFYACCIANKLLDEGRTVWLTAQMPLLRACDDFGTDEPTFRRIAEAELLILDDLRTEALSARQLELLHEILDTRYRSGRPLIVTTLLTPDAMRRCRSSASLSRIYSRLLSMCAGKDDRGWIAVPPRG